MDLWDISVILKKGGGVVKNKIIAEGELYGIKQHIECFMENGSPIIEINYEFDEEGQEHFDRLLKDPPSLGGTYYPLSNSLLAAYSVLQSNYFDPRSKVKIKVIGDIGEIPSNDEDVIY